MQSIKRIILRLKLIKLGLSKLGIVYIPQKTGRESGQPSQTFGGWSLWKQEMDYGQNRKYVFFDQKIPMKIAENSAGNPHFKTDPPVSGSRPFWGYCWPSSHEDMQSMWHDVAIAGEKKCAITRQWESISLISYML
jgi:hypothetical protein